MWKISGTNWKYIYYIYRLYYSSPLTFSAVFNTVRLQWCIVMHTANPGTHGIVTLVLYILTPLVLTSGSYPRFEIQLWIKPYVNFKKQSYKHWNFIFKTTLHYFLCKTWHTIWSSALLQQYAIYLEHTKPAKKSTVS